MRRRVYLAGLAGTGLASLAGCTALGDLGSGLLDRDDYDVGMSRNAFIPETYEATIGETVVWKNTSGAAHTVTAYENAIPDGADFFASGGFDTEDEARRAYWDDFGGAFDHGETYEHTFAVPGRYSYFCVPHEMEGRGTGRMIGAVDVVE